MEKGHKGGSATFSPRVLQHLLPGHKHAPYNTSRLANKLTPFYIHMQYELRQSRSEADGQTVNKTVSLTFWQTTTVSQIFSPSSRQPERSADHQTKGQKIREGTILALFSLKSIFHSI